MCSGGVKLRDHSVWTVHYYIDLTRRTLARGLFLFDQVVINVYSACVNAFYMKKYICLTIDLLLNILIWTNGVLIWRQQPNDIKQQGYFEVEISFQTINCVCTLCKGRDLYWIKLNCKEYFPSRISFTSLNI